jgi:hypothetical protein
MKKKSVACAATLVLMLFTKMAVAEVIVTFSQVGSDVIATGVGTINLAGLVSAGTFNGGACLDSTYAFMQVGPISGVTQDKYTGISGPASFGTGRFTGATSGTGDSVGLSGDVGYLLVPTGYVSGNPLSSSSTFARTTLSALGLTPGTATYSWGSGATADSLTVNIAAVPEIDPATGGSAFSLVAGVCAMIERRRRRATVVA